MNTWGFGARAQVFLCLAVSFSLSAAVSANVTGIVRGVQENPIAGALVTFISEANPADTFSGYTNAGGRYDIAINALGVGDMQPAPFTLHQNHPNPFNPSTAITFTTAEPGLVTLSVYNLLGQRVRTLVSGTVPAGEHFSLWDGRDDAGTPSGAGVYLYRLAGGGHSAVKKMLLLDGGSASGWAAPAPAFRVEKPTAVTWTVTITGDEIEPREMNGLEIADGGTYDFYVIFMGEVWNLHLVPISGGTFEMGEVWTTRHDSLQYGPAHPVSVSDFEISAYEVTNSQYAKFLNEVLEAGEIEMRNGDPYGKGGEWDGRWYIDLDIVYPRGNKPEPDQNCQIRFENGSFSVESSRARQWPVVAVSWYGAKAFARHYGLDLPTEAQWEFAAGGGTLEYAYATADGTIDATKSNYDYGDEYINHPVEVGSYPPNPFGLYDMSGNIFEWCNDWWERYSSHTIVDPVGPAAGNDDDDKVIRGGCYSSGVFINSDYCRTTSRSFPREAHGTQDDTFIYMDSGFRVARR